MAKNKHTGQTYEQFEAEQLRKDPINRISLYAVTDVNWCFVPNDCQADDLDYQAAFEAYVAYLERLSLV